MAFQMQKGSKNWYSLQHTSIVYARDSPLSRTPEADIFLARKKDQKLPSPLMALKIYKNNQRPSQIIQKLIDSHFSNVVYFHQVQYQSFPFCLMEFCSNNLRQFRLQTNIEQRNEQILRIAREVINGLIELKQLRIIHGDIKPENILISLQNKTKLCDLDFAITEKQAYQKCLRVGTVEYMAPQMLFKGKCSYKSDIWSFGIVVYELYFGEHPFPKVQLLVGQGQESFRNVYEILAKQIPQVRAKIERVKQKSQNQTILDIMHILLCSLNLNPEQRKSLEQLATIANRRNKNRKMSDSQDQNFEEQNRETLYHNKTLLKIFENLLSDIRSLQKGDILQKKAKELEGNLQRLVNCMLRSTQTSKYDFEALLEKFSIESRKVSTIIQNNLKRLGGGLQRILNYEERMMLREHIEVANAFLRAQNHRQKKVLQGFHSACQLSERS